MMDGIAGRDTHHICDGVSHPSKSKSGPMLFILPLGLSFRSLQSYKVFLLPLHIPRELGNFLKVVTVLDLLDLI